jgi:anti-sigma-K factor RskA
VDHVDELIPAHALGILDEDEAALVEEHLEGCARCRAQMREAQDEVSLLALTAPRIAPPPELRDRLMASIDDEVAAAPVAAEPEPREERSSMGWWPRFSRIAVPVLAVFAIGMFAWNISLHHTLNNTNATVFNATSSVSLPRVGTVFIDSSGHATLLADAGSVPSGKTYQAWVIPPGGKPISAGLFSGGRTSVDLATVAHPGDTVAVTVEPAGGSPQPTSPPISATRVT